MLVSVIIPCYNVEEYIEECISSVIDQSYKSIEIICIDNNSTDRTFSILQDLQKQYPKIQLLKELKPGAPCARNKGLDAAKGEYVQFLDADDLLKSSKIEHQVELIRKCDKRNIGFVAAACIKRTVNNIENSISDHNPEPFISPFINKCGNTCSNLWNRESLSKAGNWNEAIKSSQEADLMLRLVLDGNIFLVDPEPLTIIRERETGQISHRDPGAKWKQFIDIRLDYLSKLKDVNKNAYERFKGLYYDFLMVSVLTLAKYDKVEAIHVYDQSIKNHWISSGSYGFNKLKVAMIKIFGLGTFLKLYKG